VVSFNFFFFVFVLRGQPLKGGLTSKWALLWCNSWWSHSGLYSSQITICHNYV